MKTIIYKGIFAEVARKKLRSTSYLDGNNIVWKLIDGQWIGKRSVWTFDWRCCWLEETTFDNVKSWWCGGIDADYNEVFKGNGIF